MIDKNGPGEIKTESRSPKMASGVAMPKQASNNIAAVMAVPATRPASKPAKIAFDRLIIIVDLTVGSKRWNQIMLAERRYNFSNATRTSVARIRRSEERRV